MVPVMSSPIVCVGGLEALGIRRESECFVVEWA